MAELNSPTTPRPRRNRNPLSKLKQLFFPKPLNTKTKRRPRKPPIGRPRRKTPKPSIQRPGKARPRRPASSLRPPPAKRRRRHANGGLWPRPSRRPRRRFPFTTYLDGARNVFYRFQSRCRRLRRQIAWYAGLKVRPWQQMYRSRAIVLSVHFGRFHLFICPSWFGEVTKSRITRVT